MKKIKKAIAIVLSLAMMCTAVPASVLATINNNAASTTEKVVVDDEAGASSEDETASESDAEEETETLDESKETTEASVESNDESEASSGGETEESSEGDAEEEAVSDDKASQTVYEYEDDDISVTITLSDASDLPDGAEITVTELTGDELLECVEQLNEAADIGQDSVQVLLTSDDVFAYDISVVYDGEETEPEDEVEVCIEYSDDVLASIGAEDAQDIEIEHITDDGAVEDINTDADENRVTFTTDSFSTYAGTVSLTNTGITIDYSSLEIEKNPIMYYQKINGYTVFCASPFANNHSHTGDKVYYLGTSSSYKNTDTSNNYQNYINIESLKSTLSKVMQAYNDNNFYSGSYESYSQDYINYVIAQAYIWGYIYREATGTNVITSMISLALQQAVGLSSSNATYIAQYVDDVLSSYDDNTVYIYRVLSDSDCSNSADYGAADHQYLISLYYIVTQQTYTGYLNIKKASSNTSLTSSNSLYSLAGARYKVYSSESNAENDTNSLHTFTISSDGSSDGAVELATGTYYVKETTAGTGYELDDTIYTVTVTANSTTYVNAGTVYDAPITDSILILLYKKSADSNAGLEGAVYKVSYYTNYSASGTAAAVWYLKTDSDGKAYLSSSYLASGYTSSSFYYDSNSSVTLPLGSISVQEVEAPTGYVLDSTVYTATIKTSSSSSTGALITWSTGSSFTATNASSYTANNQYATHSDRSIRGGVEIQKRDEETDAAAALGAATLEGFVFAIINSSDESVYVDGEWYEPGETVYTLMTDENGYATTDLDGDGTDDTLPYGTYTISEISAGAGYTLTGTTEQTFEIREDGTVIDMTSVDDSIRDYVNRTGFNVSKKNGVSDALPGVLFQITSRTTGETHFFVTDENGSFSSLFTEDEEENANLNDDAISYTEVEGWYETVDADGNTIWVDEAALSSDYSIWFGQYDIDSNGDTVDGMTEADASLGGSLIYDEYEIYEVVTSVNEEYFTDKDSDLVLQFSTKNYANGVETDLGTIWNTSMSMSTLVRNQATGTQTAAAEDGIMIVDDIVVTGTNEGDTYYIKAWLVTKDGEQLGDYYYESSFTGDGTSSQEIANAIVFEDVDLTGLDGESVVVFAEIWNMEDTSNNDAVCMCFSKDLDNAEETIYIYGVSTEAVDTKNGTHTATSGDTVTITEEISYTNILPGEYYTLVAVLYDANTGEAVTDNEGNVLSASTQIYATASSLANDGSVALAEGSATVEFKVNISDIESLVVYAYLYDMQYYTNIAADGKTEVGNFLASEEEQTNADETVHLANAYTKAADYYTGDEVGIIDEDGIAMITDTVYFENLSVGETYKITATVVDKDTEEEISASGEIEFTIDENGNVYDTAVEVTEIRDDGGINGNAEVTITVSGIDGGDAVVVYEVLYVLGTDGEWYEAAEHEDIDDADQTIHYPWVKTSAADSSTGDSVGVSSEDSVLVDTVSFGNLSVGKTYYITGTIYNRTDSEKILDDDGEQVSTTVTLTIDEEGNASISDGEEVNVILSDSGQTVDGTLTVTFGFDASDYSGDTAVVYEVIEHNGYTVASHESMDDDDQSVHYPDIDTSAIDSDTGSHVGSIWGKLVNVIKTLFGATDADGNGIDDDKQQNITDTVELYNLVIGETYIVTGTLYDQGTGEPLTIGGESITASAEIEVTESGIAVISGDASNPTSQSDDSDGSIDGTIDMTYSFDSSLLDNEPTTIVVFETLYHASYAVAVHNDIDDDEQSVNDVSITTSAVDSKTEDQIGTVAETSVIIDTVEMEKLVLGEEYTVKGYLIDAEATTEDEVVYIYDSDDSIATSSLTFTASEDDEEFEMDTSDSLSASGSVLLEFSFSNELVQGKTVTVYEELYYNDVLLAVHGFTYDDNGDLIPESEQCVYYPTGKTNALDEETDAHMSDTDTVITITDMVYFQNLIVGNEYTITGTLHFAEDFITADGTRYFAGDEVIDEEGNVYTSSVTFTASASIEGAEDVVVTTLADGTEAVSGYIPITFEISTADLSGATIVAFEEFYHNDVKVFVHADITDTPQIIKIPAISTSADSSGIREVSSRTYDSDTGEYSWNVITITDTVSYWNLWTQSELDEMAEEALTIEDGTVLDTRNGEIYSISEYATYIATGYLVYADTGEPIYDTDGNMVTAYTVFSPEDEDGTVEVVYTIDFSKFVDEDGFNYLENKDLVVFEDLYHVNSETGDVDIDDITEDDHIAEHHDETDEEQTISVPKVTTDLKDSTDDDDDALACEDITLIDVVSYENLTPGYEYTVTGMLYDQETGEPILDDNGDEITAEAAFIPEEADGTVELSFTFSGVSLAGKSIVAFEEMFYKGKSVAVHADIEAEPQTVYIPKIGTSLKDNVDSEADALACEDITLIDTVSYENLLPGREYTVTGTLYDQETGEPILDDVGNKITAQTTFTPEETDGTVEVVFTFSGVSLAGKSLVAFEELYRGEKLVAVHADIDDEDQTVYIPDGHTTLLSDEGCKLVLASEEITLIDRVYYENLIVGKTYTVTGTLYDKETGEPMLDDDGNEITALASFTAEDSDGYVDVTFTFSGVSLAGKSVVAFEEMYNENGKAVFVHADINDEDQTVYIPKIKTMAADPNGYKYVTSAADGTVIDTVTYENLIAGEEYTVYGVLMDKETGEAITDSEGNEITASAVFTAEDTSGTVELTFTIPAGAFTGAAVAFEDLYLNSTLIAEHKDIDDEDQTVYFPEIGTYLADTAGDKDLDAYGEMTLIDTVSYSNLEVGSTYRLVCVLMDRSTGKATTDADGNEITGETVFTAETTDGTAEVELTFTSDGMDGEYVAFETLYLVDEEGNDTIYASHADLDNEDQTVTLTVTPQTGDSSNVPFWIAVWLAAIACIACSVFIIVRKRRKKTQ